MASDDPSRLSAYLDDELDVDARTALEAEILERPELHDELEVLRSTRDAVRHLPRPVAPCDIGLEVIRVIESRGLRAPRPVIERRPGRGAWLAVGTLGAVAASLLVAWFGHVLETAPRRRDDLLARSPRVAEARPPAPSDAKIDATLVEPPAPFDPVPTLVDRDPAPALERLEPESSSATREALAGLLGIGEPRRVVLALDRIDSNVLDRIDHLVADSARLDARHARVAVEPGVAFDASLPGRAYVYVLPLRPSEARALEASLASAFRRPITSSAVPPAVVANLAEAPGPVSLHESMPRSLVRRDAPPAAAEDSGLRALRTPVPGESLEQPSLPRPTPNDPLRGNIAVRLPDPRPTHPEPAPASSDDQDTPLTYLIWVTEGLPVPSP
jgi:hypothetical protein